MVTVPVAISQSVDSGVPTYLVRHAIERAARTRELGPTQTLRLTNRLEVLLAG
jgi:hypothetical protein